MDHLAARVAARFAAEAPTPLGHAEVAKLPIGSIVWEWTGTRVNGSPLIVIPGGKLTQIALLPERAGGQEPGGDPIAAWGQSFVLVSQGKGKLPTHGTAQRTAIAWQQSQRSNRSAHVADPNPEQFREWVIQAIKHVGAGVRTLVGGSGSYVKYNPQEEIRQDSHGIHSTFFLRIAHERVNPAFHPGINFYWNLSRGSGSVGTSNLVWHGRKHENIPLNKMADAMLAAADDIIQDLKRQLNTDTKSDEAWSVVTLGTDHGYATEVDVYTSKETAEKEAREKGNCYVVKGTQMWNEPLGQVEEHDRTAPSRFFR